MTGDMTALLQTSTGPRFRMPGATASPASVPLGHGNGLLRALSRPRVPLAGRSALREVAGPPLSLARGTSSRSVRITRRVGWLESRVVMIGISLQIWKVRISVSHVDVGPGHLATWFYRHADINGVLNIDRERPCHRLV